MIEMSKQYTWQDFIEIIAALRSEHGCPWDKEQTHESLKPCMMEEAAELLGAIRIYDRTGSYENMREELGDILLQVVMHSQIAKEEGLFTLEDVIQEVSEKMVRRHPHVFGTVTADSSEEVLQNWDEIKKKEKEGKSWIESPLREIPAELPALVRAPKILKKIDKLYKPAQDAAETIHNLEETLRHYKAAAEMKNKSEEIEALIGEMLLGISNIARQFKLSSEQILTDRIEDLIDQYEPAENSK